MNASCALDIAEDGVTTEAELGRTALVLWPLPLCALAGRCVRGAGGCRVELESLVGMARLPPLGGVRRRGRVGQKYGRVWPRVQGRVWLRLAKTGECKREIVNRIDA